MAHLVSKLVASGGAADEFTSVAAWQTAHGRSASKDLVNNGDSVELQCFKGDYTSVGGGVNFIDEAITLDASWVTEDPETGDNTITFTCPETERHDGTPGSGFRWRSDTAYSRALHAGSINVLVEWIDFYTTRSGATAQRLINSGLGGALYLRNLILEGNGAGNGIELLKRQGRCVENCLIINFDVGIHIGGYVNYDVYNCTIVDCDTAIEVGTIDYNAYDVVNTVAYNCTEFWNDGGSIDDFGTLTGYNATSDTSGAPAPDKIGGGSNYGSNVLSTDFVDAANDDYHLASGSGLRGIGFDASATFTNDLDGDTRSAWDIGADEFSGGAPEPAFIPRPMWF